MSVITQYLIVIVIYFVAMLGIGILAGRKITNDGDDYFLAKDKLSAAAIGFSFSATQMSGSTYLGTVGTLSTIGYPFVPGALSSAAAPWFCYILLGDRVRQVAARLKSVTLGDIIESRYGKAASILSTCLMLVCLIPSVAGQLEGGWLRLPGAAEYALYDRYYRVRCDRVDLHPSGRHVRCGVD